MGYKVTIQVTLKGNDKMAMASLECDLPFPPSAGIGIAGLCTIDQLLVDHVIVSAVNRRTEVYVLPVEEDAPLAALMGCFSDDWEWDDPEPLPKTKKKRKPGGEAQTAVDEKPLTSDDLIDHWIKKRNQIAKRPDPDQGGVPPDGDGQSEGK